MGGIVGYTLHWGNHTPACKVLPTSFLEFINILVVFSEIIMGRRHLLALDGREEGEKALDWYIENFYRKGDQVVIFHSSSFNLHIGMPGAMVNVDSVQQQVTDAQNRIESITQLATEKLKLHDVQGYVRTKTGHSPADLINECVEEEKVDHVFMGTRDL